ncbi:MAG: hypothetical protein ACQCN6_14150 [Candidatus Bathyarchaeia archaeon]|jgi:hypothetical protein
MESIAQIKVTAILEESGKVPTSVTPHIMSMVSETGLFTLGCPISSGLSITS